MSARTIIIGDIHGMLLELQHLLGGLTLTSEDVVVSVGDLVDKGPSSAGVVRYLRELRESGIQIVLVQGNHEETHSRFRKALQTNPAGTSKFKGAEELLRITQALTPEDVAFLDSAVLYHKIPAHNALVVHAGIPPLQKTLPTLEEIPSLPRGEQERLKQLLRVRHVTGKRRVSYTLELGDTDSDIAHEDGGALSLQEVLTRLGPDTLTRIIKTQITPKGSFLGLGEETPEDPYWADVYDGRFGFVYFGHTAFHEQSVCPKFPHARGLDLGAVYGNKLAAVVLEEGCAEQFLYVDAKEKHSSVYGEE